MTAYKLTIVPEGSAFDRPSEEVARILRDLAERIETAGAVSAEMVVRDINGNKCGRMEHRAGCRLVEDLASDIMQGRRSVSTAFGHKSATGIAEMIRNAIDEY